MHLPDFQHIVDKARHLYDYPKEAARLGNNHPNAQAHTSWRENREGIQNQTQGEKYPHSSSCKKPFLKLILRANCHSSVRDCL